MTSDWDRPAESVELASADSQRAYVAIQSSSEQFGAVREAVDVRVVREGDRSLIDDIVRGRPKSRMPRDADSSRQSRGTASRRAASAHQSRGAAKDSSPWRK